MPESGWWVDHAAHILHGGDTAYPCDRDVEAMAVWAGHALLLSSDTDCLSLWDSEGLIRTARVGVYAQDMGIWGDHAVVCGGADGQVHLLSLPELAPLWVVPCPGMPERVALRNNVAYILSLIPEPTVHTALLTLDLTCPKSHEVASFPGIPGAIATDETGLWIAVSEQLLHLPDDAVTPDVTISGFGLIRNIQPIHEGFLLADSLEGKTWLLRQFPDGCWSLLPTAT